MADQLNLLDNDRVVPIALHEEMQRSYLEYAMSVIVGRALPDVRDGLKPVQRRILYAMHELGLTPDRPYRKCARVVGDVLGKYHPHGDQSVYDALVRLVQDFSCRYPLLDGHGNFGSVDNDPPAAMRYTETRLAPVSNEGLLGEIGDETVDFTDNFDSSQQEPVVLPAQLPFLLLNGCSGIAVGMATNIPPHNLGEIIDGLISLIDRPNITDESLRKIIPGPDFPTGGEIVGLDGVIKAYTQGRGSIPVRGVASVEEIQPGRGRRRRTAIIVTELPYQVNKAGWIEKVADLVNHDKLSGISDIRDESDRDGMRVVIELKREGNPAKLLQQLYQKTALQSNFGAIFLTIVDGQPLQLSLKQVLEEFLKFREETLTRRYRHSLDQAENRLEIVEGLLKALEDLDRLIEILREAPDAATAKAQFQVEFDLSDRQSDAILAMPMRRITGIEQQKLHDEEDQLLEEVERLEKLLGDRRELLKSLKKDLRALKRKYATPRRTAIQTKEEAAQFVQEVAETFVESGQVDEPAALELSQKGYVRRLQMKTYKRQGLPEANPSLEEAEDFATQVEIAKPDQVIVAFTRDGKAFSVPVRETALIKRIKDKGDPIITLLPDAVQADPDNLLSTFVLPEDYESKELILVTQKGQVKRLPLSDCAGLTGRGLTLTKLKDEDQVQFVLPANENDSLILATTGGRMLRFRIRDDQLPQTNRNNRGVKAIRMRSTERIVGCVAVGGGAELLLVSAKGYVKRMPADLLSVGNRGDLGNAGFKFALKSDSLAAMATSGPDAIVTLVTDQERVAYLDTNDIKIYGRDSNGKRLIQPERSENIVAVSVLTMQTQ